MLYVSILLVVQLHSSGAFSWKTDWSEGCWTNANWNGEKPYTLVSELFAFAHHERANSKYVLVSSKVLSNI